MRFTPEQTQFASAVREFCANECGTLAQRRAWTDDGAEQTSRALVERFAQLGWLGVSIPEAYGGAGAGMVEECIFLHQTCRGLAPIDAYSTSLIAGATYLRWGSETQRQKILGGICAGRIEALGLSEPGAGSDLASARCAARRDGADYVVDGQKTWTSAAHLADHILTLTRTDPAAERHHGLTLLVVPADAPGVEIRGIDTMGGRVVNDVHFSDVRVPASAVVGQAGRAWSQLTRGLSIERVIIAAMSLGSAERALADAIAYVGEREQFGRTIGSFGALRHRIADLATEIAACHALVYDVAQRVDAGEEDELSTLASMAKLKCTATAKQTTLEGMQLMGGYGYAREYGMEEQVRNALAPPIYGGTNEIQREIIARNLGLGG